MKSTTLTKLNTGVRLALAMLLITLYLFILFQKYF